MGLSEKVSKEFVELETLKTFLRNKGKAFDGSLIEHNTSEPTDIKYDSVNYQITIGDKEHIEKMRRVTSKGKVYTNIRNVSDIANLLLRGALEKKANRSDKNTILLIEVESRGGRSWPELQGEISGWISQNLLLLSDWLQIYSVFNDKNIQLRR